MRTEHKVESGGKDKGLLQSIINFAATEAITNFNKVKDAPDSITPAANLPIPHLTFDCGPPPGDDMTEHDALFANTIATLTYITKDAIKHDSTLCQLLPTNKIIMPEFDYGHTVIHNSPTEATAFLNGLVEVQEKNPNLSICFMPARNFHDSNSPITFTLHLNIPIATVIYFLAAALPCFMMPLNGNTIRIQPHDSEWTPTSLVQKLKVLQALAVTNRLAAPFRGAAIDGGYVSLLTTQSKEQ
jgi:hypothetical protein